MMDLQRFINKMANNPLVQPLPELTAFLTETSNAVWDNRAAWYEKGTVAKVVSSMSSWFNQVRRRLSLWDPRATPLRCAAYCTAFQV